LSHLAQALAVMLTIKILTTSNSRQKMSHHHIHLDHHGKDMKIIFIVFAIIIMTNSCINASAVGWEKSVKAAAHLLPFAT
jgi:hypothetical protein